MKFPLLTLKTYGKLYFAVVRSAMLHGSETWAPTDGVMQ